jgi:hypothetical protein
MKRLQPHRINFLEVRMQRFASMRPVCVRSALGRVKSVFGPAPPSGGRKKHLSRVLRDIFRREGGMM